MTRRRSDSDLLGIDPPKPRRGNPPGVGGRAATQTRDRLNAAQAALAELRAAKLRGDLVPAADVRATWAGMMADVRQRLLAVPGRIEAPREIVAQVDREIRAALLALASQESDSNAADL
jgi:terminase small subunit / prophage DNA-packing protein